MPSLPRHLQAIPAGKETLPREVVEEHQRARVIEAAIRSFAASSYPATTVEDLVDAAQIGVGTFYALFGGKEACLLAAHDQIVEEVGARLRTAAGAKSSWADQACLGLRALLELVRAEPARAKIALIEIQTGGPPALQAYERSLQPVLDFLRRGRAEVAGDRVLPAALEQTTVNGIAWLLRRRLAAGDTASLDSLYGELAQLVLEPYLGEDGARRQRGSAGAAVGA